jgi:hypothetical protein
MRRDRLVLLLALALIAAAAIAPACGDDGGGASTDDPLDAYFAELADIGRDFVEGLAVQPQGLDPEAPIAEQVDVYETYATGLAANIRSARNSLRDLDAPEEAVDAHAGLLSSVESALAAAEALEDELGTISSNEELARLSILDNPDLLAALQQCQAACQELRDIAAENDIAQQIRCE